VEHSHVHIVEGIIVLVGLFLVNLFHFFFF
jgi:hypothetical protein